MCPPIDPIGPLGSEARELRIEPVMRVHRREHRDEETEEEAQQRRREQYEALARARMELEATTIYDDHGRTEHEPLPDDGHPHIDLSA
ncbi:MAG: hypothetical protein JWO69_1329 [Thermoleophilia bacterium]|jgi:hypothetical protein|nr:hypothetical protein [Thermoleophilia bacterium]